jgi:hypothetical protein
MDERELREIDADRRVSPMSNERATEPPDDLARRREQQQRALTDRERAERWPCG